MLKHHRRQFAELSRICDILLIYVSIVFSFYLRYKKVSFHVLQYPLQYLVFLGTYLVLWIYLSRKFQLYYSKRMSSIRAEIFDLFKILTFCTLGAIVPAFFIRNDSVSRFFVIDFLFVQLMVLCSFRVFIRKFLHFIRKRGFNFRYILVVGRNNRAEEFLQKVMNSPEFGFHLVGTIDAENPDRIPGTSHDSIKYIGLIEDIERIIRTRIVDEVFIFLPIKSFYDEIQEILRICETVGVEMKIPTDFFNLKVAQSSISTYANVQMVDLYTSPRMGWKLVVKRAIDLVISSTGIVVFSPFMLCVALAIALTSGGPVLFRQRRIGYNGRVFELLKFRTMVINAPALKQDLLVQNEMDGPVFKIRNDPRITKIGKWLRKTSMDELPQLFNVLKGEMSLVGPRPPLPEEVDQYNLQHLRRLSMAPGITCLWQVRGRNAVSFEQWMELDREYINSWSLALDFSIMLRTIPTILKGSGV